MSKTMFTIYMVIILAVPIERATAVRWEVRADIPQHVYGHGGAVVQDKLYNIGGCETADWTIISTKIQIYDYKTDTWSKAGDMPIDLGWPMVAVYGDNVYVFGGMRSGAVSTDKAWKYDPANDSWTTVAELPIKAMNGIALTVGDYIYVGLGYQRLDKTPKGVMENFRNFYRYDPDRDSYKRLADAPEGACYAAPGAYAGNIYIVHGASYETGFHDMNDYGWTDGVLCYDIEDDSWRRIDIPRIRTRIFFLTQCTSSAVHREKLFVCGGQSYYKRTTVSSYFDMKRERFFGLPDLPKPRCCGGGGVAGSVVNSHIILSGGFWGVGETSDPASPTWALNVEKLLEPGEVITNSIGMKLAYIPAGQFIMGSAVYDQMRQYDEHQRPVRLSKPFFIGVMEVTQKQWLSVMGYNRSEHKGENLPAEKLSWNEAVEFCKLLGEKEEKKYRLPTEAEWEFACRADDHWGAFSGTGKLDDMGFYDDNSDGVTHQVGTKMANSWGLYDMHGNVAEWCNDFYAADYPTEGVVDPVGPETGTTHVIRGGGWNSFKLACRCAARSSAPASYQYTHTGFRVVMEVTE
jgi:formylglycine-generating enzyme required for sulfatase activity